LNVEGSTAAFIRVALFRPSRTICVQEMSSGSPTRPKLLP
jgi:hypothetical protein